MGYPGLTNHVVPIPGTSVTAYLGVFDKRPFEWVYTLWTDDHQELATGTLDMSAVNSGQPLALKPEQAARIAFTLEIEYGECDCGKRCTEDVSVCCNCNRPIVK